MAADLPNIVMLIADDAGRRDLGCYGHPTIRTPQLRSHGPERGGLAAVHTGAPERTPVLLCLGFLEPHRPYRRSRAGGRYGAGDAVVPPYLADTAKVRADLTRYYTAISSGFD